MSHFFHDNLRTLKTECVFVSPFFSHALEVSEGLLFILLTLFIQQLPIAMTIALHGALAAIALAGTLVLCAAHDRPTVGILTQQYNSTHTYIAASYVKWVEGAGARAVPLFYERWDQTAMLKMLHSVNGVLLPGGGAEFKGAYWDALQTLFNYAKDANADGVHFPIWGTCLGVCCQLFHLHLCTCSSLTHTHQWTV